ncbi:MAG: 50S ribosomal protein L9 [Magnetococcales bacterium]|nr:50S ribosomal protein L9 [Magnetococcales bacterium]NGZ05587.1 50S ribosomal protein L9 [Magnetococcales bacterium]
MEVILLEKIGKLGDLGAVVQVRPGYGRNFLIPQGKALPATRRNKDRFEQERMAFEARQQELFAQAQALAGQIAAVDVVLDRPAGAADKLFGSVTNADIAAFFAERGIALPRGAIDVPYPIRTLGDHTVRIRLHPDIIPDVKVRVERRATR